MRKIIVLSILSLFLLPSSVFASVTYSRSPLGTEVTSPVTVNFSFTDFEGDFSPTVGEDRYCLYVTDSEGGDVTGTTHLSSETSVQEVFNIPVGSNIIDIIAMSFPEGEICGNGDGYVELETLGGSPNYIFTVIEATPPDVGVTALTETAAAAFSGAMGFTWDDVTTFTGDNVKLVVGGGIGVLSSLLPWIISLLMIGAAVMLIYSAFRFFRH